MDADMDFSPDFPNEVVYKEAAPDEAPPAPGSRKAKRLARFVSYKHATEDYAMPYEEFCELEREQRVAGCGRTFFYCDPATGGMKFFTAECHQYRLCPKCLAKRAEKFKAQVLTAAGHHNGYLWVSTGEAGGENVDEIKEGGKRSYAAFPVEGGELVVFHKEQVAGASKMKVEALVELDWERLACTPEGSRATGSLGKVAAAEADDGLVAVEIDAVATGAPVPVQIRARNEAMQQVGLLEPHTLDEALEANNQLMTAYFRILLGYGFSARFQTVKRKIKSITPSWERYRFYFLNGCGSDPVFKMEFPAQDPF